LVQDLLIKNRRREKNAREGKGRSQKGGGRGVGGKKKRMEVYVRPAALTWINKFLERT